VSIGTVVLLPPAQLGPDRSAGWPGRREIQAELLAYGINTLVIPEAPEPDEELDLRGATANWVAHNAIALSDAQPPKPVLLVASGAAGSLLPALGFSQRASRRPVAGYVVVDGELPKAGAADWPDAPVTYITSANGGGDGDAAAREAELRGWTVVNNNEAAMALLEIARD